MNDSFSRATSTMVSGPDELGTSPLRAEDVSLSLTLRHETAALHDEVERRLGLPSAITNLNQYRACLERFYRFYLPLELALMRFRDWKELGIDLQKRLQASRLADDLNALGVSPSQLEDAPPSSLPTLQSFAPALGVLYVVEGSKLGSQYMLPHLRGVLGEEIADADSFFAGHGEKTAILWREFRASLDRFGSQHPEETSDVVQGAKATFKAIGEWMRP